MKTFTDSGGRTWTVAIHVTAVKRVRAALGIHLAELITGPFDALGEFLADPVKLVDTMYVLCRDEAERAGVSDEDFGRAMAGDSLLFAREALVAELVAFLPDAHARDSLRKLLDTANRVADARASLLAHEVDSFDVDAAVRKLLDPAEEVETEDAS
jgi:hypothetical protein